MPQRQQVHQAEIERSQQLYSSRGKIECTIIKVRNFGEFEILCALFLHLATYHC